ncbi:MAG: 50S ribosomal protein L4 [Puniceicoccaceae bacterium]|nr:MAG: 50S ribosomal protein L4 [Puniceicoccaceae bacterium]
MKLKVFQSDGSTSSETDFDGLPVFEGDKGVQALKETVVAQAANRRQGNACTKTRGEVRGGGKKPWRQKGTGRARHGSTRSPIWTGGGVVFGPRPRDYSKKLNRKVKMLAFSRALFDRIQAGELMVIEAIELSEPKTKLLAGLLQKIVPDGSILLIDAAFSDGTILAARNMSRVDLQEAPYVSATDLCLHDHIVVTRRGLEALIARTRSANGKAAS